ncbi:MAG: protein kinase [Planctomycetota bacterium]
MNGGTQGCLEPEALDGFLNEEMPADERLRAEEHLSHCTECVERLDAQVTQGQSWESLRANLSDYSSTSERKTAPEGVEEFAAAEVDLKDIIGPTDDPDYIGRLGRYEIEGIIGRGSAGIVLKGFDRTLNRCVAIKMLAPGLAHAGASRKRFEREARAIAAVRHANVIEIYGVDEYRERPYIVMQYFPDGSLHNRLEKSGWMNDAEICRIGAQVARGLAEAHRQGIIHRDVKPANILFENGTECAVLSDFGLARVADEATMTNSGTIAGTPQFMSPEQARGESLDPRADLFSLGCVMYAAATGHSPFRASTLMGVVHRVCQSSPRSIRECNSEIAPWLEDFISRLLAKDREDRFSSATEVDELLTSELAHLQMPSAVPPPKRNWIRKSNFQRDPSVGKVARLGIPRIRQFFWRKWIAATIGIFFIVAAISFVLIGPRLWDRNNEPTYLAHATSSYGITPTRQEKSFFEAQAAYELAYETHLAELAERGDMAKSKAAHRKAIALGFNARQSYFNLAAALAYEGNVDAAFQNLEMAYQAGFHNLDALRSQRELDPLRDDRRYSGLYQRVEKQQGRFDEADKSYFSEDYAKAEELYRQWLKLCPNDEHAAMMLGASLLEQEKLVDAKSWNQKTRQSVLYCSFGSYNLGCIAALEKDSDLAFNWLNFAADTGFTDHQHLSQDHHLESLREDPRFELLRTRMKEIRAPIEHSTVPL